jgi:hypothetical protein
MAVDFAAVRANADKQGIDLQEIAICYENLTEEEARVLTTRNLIGKDLGRAGAVLGKFTSSGEALFPDKAVGVLYLGA